MWKVLAELFLKFSTPLFLLIVGGRHEKNKQNKANDRVRNTLRNGKL